MKVTIDRFEEDFAVLELEGGETVSAPKELFKEFDEGDRIVISKDEKSPVSEDETPTSLFEKLRQKSKQKSRVSQTNSEESVADFEEKRSEFID